MDSGQSYHQEKEDISKYSSVSSWNLLNKLLLPPEIIVLIASYDRVLSVKKLPKTDIRYTMLHTVQPFRYSYLWFSNCCHSYSYLHFKNSSKMYVYFIITENNQLLKILYMYSSHHFVQNENVLDHCYVRL